MINFRKFILNLLTASWLFLSCFVLVINTVQADTHSQKTATKSKSGLTHKKPQAPEKKTRRSGFGDDQKDATLDDPDALEKPLDLSIPFKSTENTGLTTPSDSPTQSLIINIFTPETIKKPRPLEVEGDFVMSPEPEAEKRKSVDGAGFVIRLKP